MQVQFHAIKYNLVDNPNISSTRFQSTIEKGNNTFDSIINDTLDIEEIKIYDNEDQVTAIYTGYAQRIAICIYGDNSISIELENTDIVQQLNDLTNELVSQQQQINNKVDSSVFGDTETIGEPANQSYNVDDTFYSNGQLYKVIAPILKGNILVENGNCEITNLNEEIQSLKEDEI